MTKCYARSPDASSHRAILERTSTPPREPWENAEAIGDPEFAALRSVLVALQPLDPEQRARILDYVWSWSSDQAKKKSGYT